MCGLSLSKLLALVNVHNKSLWIGHGQKQRASLINHSCEEISFYNQLRQFQEDLYLPVKSFLKNKFGKNLRKTLVNEAYCFNMVAHLFGHFSQAGYALLEVWEDHRAVLLVLRHWPDLHGDLSHNSKGS